jgi:hypothetical protein
LHYDAENLNHSSTTIDGDSSASFSGRRSLRNQFWPRRGILNSCYIHSMDHPDYPAGEKGRCWTCGYLAKYRTPNNTYHEVSIDERVQCSKRLFLHRLDGSSGYYDVDAKPECFVRAYPIGDDIACISPDVANRFGEIDKILHLERNCSEWRPHIPGFNPRDHLEDYKMIELEKDRRRFERAIVRYNHSTERRFQRLNITLIIVSIAAATIFSIVNLWISYRETPLERFLRHLLGDN